MYLQTQVCSRRCSQGISHQPMFSPEFLSGHKYPAHDTWDTRLEWQTLPQSDHLDCLWLVLWNNQWSCRDQDIFSLCRIKLVLNKLPKIWGLISLNLIILISKPFWVDLDIYHSKLIDINIIFLNSRTIIKRVLSLLLTTPLTLCDWGDINLSIHRMNYSSDYMTGTQSNWN